MENEKAQHTPVPWFYEETCRLIHDAARICGSRPLQSGGEIRGSAMNKYICWRCLDSVSVCKPITGLIVYETAFPCDLCGASVKERALVKIEPKGEQYHGV
jgi:hypothetical protein